VCLPPSQGSLSHKFGRLRLVSKGGLSAELLVGRRPKTFDEEAVSLLAPAGLWFLLAGPIVLLLYLIQSRYRPRVVASLLLWKRMARDLEAEAAWRRPRWDALLALQLLVALLAGLALARPAVLGGGGQRLVMVLDTSASMAARDVSPSRFAAARQQVMDSVNGAPPGTRVWLVTSGAVPRLVVDDGSPADVVGALDGLQPEAVAGDLPTALMIAAGLAAPEAGNGSQVVAVTDGAFSLDLPPQAVPISFKFVGGGSQNLAVSDVSLRRPVETTDYLAGFARVVNFGSDPRTTSMTIIADGLPVDRAPIQVDGGSHAEATFRVPASAQSVSVVLAERAPLAADDRVDVVGYARSARRVTIVSDAPSAWEHVLSVVPNVSIRSIHRQDFPPSDFSSDDIVLLDGLPPDDVRGSGLIVVNPPDGNSVLNRVESGPRLRRAANFDADDPLLLGVDIGPLIVQQVQLAAMPAWATASVSAEDTPLILHGRMGDQRLVIFAFDPTKSNLPHLAAFPLLMANVVDWLTPGRTPVLQAGLGSKSNIQPRAIADIPASNAAAPAPALAERWPWLLAAAGVVFLLEWAVAIRRG
jgi:Ca-activated chloride channel homolog